MKRFFQMAVALLVFASILMLSGCASSGVSTGATSTQKLAAAKLIARDAGRLVAIANPTTAAAVKSAYAVINSQAGADYKAAVFDQLQALLDDQGVQGSSALRADAEDLLALFGIDLAAIDVDIALLDQFDESAIRAVAEAFVQGMAG